MRVAAFLTALSLVLGAVLLPVASAQGAPIGSGVAAATHDAHDCCDEAQGTSRGAPCVQAKADAPCVAMGCRGGLHDAVVMSAPTATAAPSAGVLRTFRFDPVALGPPPPAPRAGCGFFILYCRLLS